MKKINILFAIILLAGGFASCEYDNYEEPKSQLSGTIHYDGDPINVAYNEVSFQLWEEGWELEYPIDVEVAQDGTYSAKLFNGTYMLIIDENQGPFRNIPDPDTGSDSIQVELTGSQELDIEVEPYYMIRNADFNASGDEVNASFSLEQIITGDDARNVEAVHLSVHKRKFVDNRNNLENTVVAGGDIEDFDNISLSVNVPDMTPSQDYVFARIGVKIEGVEDLLFSEVVELDL
ncbi:MAG: DUF3823 domain-containing protein [Marinilabiliaceae bacterium]